MEDDDLARFGEMEAIAHYADVLESTCDHEGECALGWSQMIMADLLPYWTGANQRWLELMCDLIAANRDLAALESRWWCRLWAWVQRGL